MLSIFSALLLAAQPAPSPDAPMATQRQTPRIPEAAAPASPADLPVPAGAPSDDFGLVAWCHGALRGHLELAELIKDKLPIDDEQQAIGREYLRSYDAAIAAAPQSKTTEGARAALEARTIGHNTWAAARAARNRETQVFTYLGWQLPGRCEHAAKRLTSTGDLLGAAMRTPAARQTQPQPEPQQQ